MPVTLMTWGLPEPSSPMLIVPVRVPATVGLNVMLMEQEVPTLIPPLQLSVSEKSPVAAIPLTFKGKLPTFLKSTVCATEVCPTVVEENVKDVDAACPSPIHPVPIAVMTCGEAEDESAMVTVPVRSPGVFGVKLTVTLHADPSLRDPMQF